MQDTALFIVGATVGAAVAAALLIYFSQKKKGSRLKTLSIDVLTYKEVSVLFKDNISKYPTNTKMALMLLNEKNLNQLQQSDLCGLDTDKNLIVAFYNSDTSSILDVHIIQFNEIDTNLQALLIEKEGIVLIEE